MNDQLRIGFLGAGLIATYHSKSLRHSGVEAELGVVRAGVYDIVPERAAAFAAASGHHVCASEDEVLDGCDAVYVCTWTSEHPRQVAAAVARGLAVFCEKPLAVDTHSAERMAELIVAAGLTNQVGLVLRRSPAYQWAKYLIDDPAAGRVMSVVFRDDQFIPIQGHYASTWRADRRLVGAGTLVEHSIHDVDMLRFLVGEIDRVSANTANFHGHDGIEDVAAATIGFRGGAIGTLTSVWHDNLARPSLRRVEVFCERRHVVVEGDDWYGPVSWTDSDGDVGRLEGDALEAAAAPLVGVGRTPTVRSSGRWSTGMPRTPTSPPPSRPTGSSTRCTARPPPTASSCVSMADAAGPSPSTGAPWVVVELTEEETHPVRLEVLRADTPTKDVAFAEDGWPGTVHLGVRIDGRPVATSTWILRPLPDAAADAYAADGPHRVVDLGGRDPRVAPSVQLRGMATLAHLQGSGIGAALVDAGCAHARAAGAELVWANARDAALTFYERAGFAVVGDGFVDATTGLPHHVVLRRP